MGASDFSTIGHGKTAQEAFNSAQDAARWECGNGGYTGTIAEKHSFTEIPRAPTLTIREQMEQLEERFQDKWGPAGCLKIEDGKYVFFGVASS